MKRLFGPYPSKRSVAPPPARADSSAENAPVPPAPAPEPPAPPAATDQAEDRKPVNRSALKTIMHQHEAALRRVQAREDESNNIDNPS